jgi:nitroreductase
LPETDTNASELLRALKHRKTSREFADRPLDRRMLADLLWAGNGVNRADGGRTAPSAHNVQSIDIYVADASGLYRYDAQHRALDVIKAGDLRALTGLQSYAATAPVDLVFVNDDRRFAPEITAEQRTLFAAAGAGAVMENIYLFCAAHDLNVAVRADIDREALAKAMGLVPEQRIILAQSVGYPPTLASLKTSLKRLLGRD